MPVTDVPDKAGGDEIWNVHAALAESEERIAELANQRLNRPV
jgi:hypothetical protein